MEIEFRIPYPSTKRQRTVWTEEYSLNKYYSGKPWTQRQKDAKFWHELTTTCLTKYKIPQQLYEIPVEIWFGWDDGWDIDNHAVVSKMITDALKGWVIKDDTRKYLKAVHHVFIDNQDSIIILIRPYVTKAKYPEKENGKDE